MNRFPGEEKKRLKEIFEEIMDEKVPKLMQGINPQIQEAQQTPRRITIKKTTFWHIIVLLLKTKDQEKISWKKTDPLHIEENAKNNSFLLIGNKRGHIQ